MYNKLIIIGASGHGKVLADIAKKMDQWKEIDFLDDDESVKEVMGFNVLGKIQEAFEHKDTADFIVGIGNNAIRKSIQEELSEKNFSIATLIHPNATLGIDVNIGEGTAVFAGVVINSSTEIGKGCIINTSSSIDHDNVLGDYIHISPGVRTGGTVVVGNGTWIGIGSTLINGIKISGETVIGAGSVVVDSINEKGIYMGIPSKRYIKDCEED